MKQFFKYAPIFYTLLLFLLNMKLINNTVIYPFLVFMALMVFLYILSNPKIYLLKYFIVFLIINLVNFIYLVLFHQTIESLLYVFAKFTLYTLIIISVYKNKDFYIRYIPKFLIYFIVTVLVVGLITHPVGGGRYGGLLGNPNSLGLVSALLFGIVFLKNKLKNIDNFILFIAVIMVLLSGSRNALLGIGIALLLKSKFSIKNILIIFFGLFVISISYIYLSQSLGLETGLERTNLDNDESFNLRKLSLYYGFETVMASPWVGNGPDKYGYLDTNLVPSQFLGLILGPHNSFLSLWIQYGIPMGTFLFLLILTQIYKIYKWKDKNLVLFFIMAYLFVASAFESYLFSVNGFETMIFWVVLAINVLMYGTRNKKIKASNLLNRTEESQR